MTAKEILHEAWLELRNGFSQSDWTRFSGMISMASQLGMIDQTDAELWRRSAQTCPGHDDEGPRDWCAYCGKMPPEESPP